MKKSILIGLLVITITISIVLMSNFLRWPEESIRTKMLKLTPIDTNMEDVITLVENKEKWKIEYIFNEQGYYFKDGRPSRGWYEGEFVVGVKSMEVYIGEYRSFWVTDVSIFYAFDEDSKLINIAVLKERDSL